ncbi:MAG: preprotein translocase subunit SecG [Bacteroidia bacterium]
MGFLSILIIIVCILLVIIVLVQNSKGGGLASNFASNNQVMGVRRTADFLEKATWGFAIALFVLSLLSTPKRGSDADAATGSGSATREIASQNPATTPSTNAPVKTTPVAPKKP